MCKISKKARIKELENQVEELRRTLVGFMSFVGYEGKEYVTMVEKINIETITINISNT